MANGTRNVFITQTKNPFLPYIQAFTDYMGQYMQQQGALAEKMYVFSKEKEGRQFLDVYGTKIREAKTPEELSRVTTEAIQYGSTRGLNSQLSVLGALSQGQGNYIKLGQDKEKAGLFVDMIKSQLQGTTVNYGGNQMTDTVAAMNDIIAKTSDPTTQVVLLEQLVKGVNQNVQGLVKGKDNQYYVSPGVVNPMTKEVISSGEPIPISSANGKDFLDVNKNKQYDAGEKYLSPDIAQDLTKMRISEEEQRQQSARFYGELNQVTMYNPETNSYGTFLQDRQGRTFKFDEKGNKGEQVNPSGWVSGVDYSRMTKTSASGVNLARKEKNLVINDINNLIFGDKELAEAYGKSSSVRESSQGNKYFPEINLNQMLGTIQKKAIDRPNDLNKYEKKIIEKGILKKWQEDYWNKRKDYQSTYQQYTGTYKEKPTFDDNEPTEPYLNEQSTPSEPVIIEKNGVYQVYNTDGSIAGTAMTKQAADDIVKKLGKKKEEAFNNPKEGY